MQTSCVERSQLKLAAPLPAHSLGVMTTRIYQPTKQGGNMRCGCDSVESGVHAVSKETGHAKTKKTIFVDRGNAGSGAFRHRRATCFIASVALLAPVSALADIIGESGVAGLGGTSGMRGGDGGDGHAAVVITDTTPFVNAERVIGGAGGGGAARGPAAPEPGGGGGPGPAHRGGGGGGRRPAPAAPQPPPRLPV